MVYFYDMYTHPNGPQYRYGNLFEAKRNVIPMHIQEQIRQSCAASNVRGYHQWRSHNDGRGHHKDKNQLNELYKARCKEYYVYQTLCDELHALGICPDKVLTGPNFDMDSRAQSDMSIIDGNRFQWKIEVKGSGNSERNGYVFQVQRKSRNDKLFYCSPFFDPHMEGTTEWLEEGRTLVFCVKDHGNGVYGPDVVWGRMLRDLTFADPIRKDLHGLKKVVYPRDHRKMHGTPLQIFSSDSVI